MRAIAETTRGAGFGKSLLARFSPLHGVLAGFIHPCQPTLVANPPVGPGWLHEVKHDGYRLLARKEADRVTLWTRYGTDFTDRLRGIAEGVGSLPVDNALIDGEAVVFRSDGHSDFAALRTRAARERASFVTFDLLSLGAWISASARSRSRRAWRG
jgi:bifunctional non-homologous end joining protein LigD